VFFATMRSFYNVKHCFFAKNPSLAARGAREAYWNHRAQRYMFTPFEGA